MADVTPARPAAGLLALVGLVTFLTGLVGIDARATYGARVSADEPQYLLTALSLGEDLDLDISDEIATERFRPFHEVDLDPQTIELNDAGQHLSPHDPLLPLLLALPTVLGGWAGAKAAMAVMGALAAMATVVAAVTRFGVAAPTAAVVAIGCFAAPPLGVYATQIYPEIPAALCTVVGLLAVSGQGRRWSWTAVAVLVALPWLSVKYAPVAVVLGVAWAARSAAALTPGRPRTKRAARLLGVPGGEGREGGHEPGARTAAAAQAVVLAVAAVAYLVLHRRIYGGWTVYAAGDHFVDGEFQVVGANPDYLGRSRRLIGLLIDRGFGLGAWNPALLALPAALAALAARRRGPWVVLTATAAAGWATATWVALTMHGWWWPGRQVVVVLPLGVIALAALVDGSRRRVTALVAASAVATLTWWWVAWEASTDRRTLIVDFEATAAPWYRVWRLALPDHRRFDPIDLALTVAWTVALAASALVAWRHPVHQRRPEDVQPVRPAGPPGGSARETTPRSPLR